VTVCVVGVSVRCEVEILNNFVCRRFLKSSAVVMALNKLSIDKLDLKDKRVLIRYVSEKSMPFFFVTPTVSQDILVLSTLKSSHSC